MAQLRNKSGIGVDHWSLLELKSLSEAAVVSLFFVVRQIDVKLKVPVVCLIPKPGAATAPLFFSLCCAFVVEQQSCRVHSWLGTLPGRAVGLGGKGLQRAAVRHPQET